MRDFKTRLQTAAVGLFFYGLSLNLLLALAGISRYTGLQYSLGYDVHSIDLVIFTRQIDPIVWLATTAETFLAAIVLSVASVPRERVAWVIYLLGSLMLAAVFLTGRSVVALAISALFVLSFLVSTTLLRKRLEIRTQPLGAFMTVTGFLALLVLNESSALALRVVSVLFPSIAEALKSLANTTGLQMQLSAFLFTFSPVLMLVAIFVWIPVVGIILRMSRREVNGASSPKMRAYGINIPRAESLILLGLAFVAGAFVALSPYANLTRLRGVDTYFYYNYLSSSSIADIMNGVMSKPEVQNRLPYLILLYLVKAISGWDTFHVIIVTPAFLAAIFTSTTYVLTKEFMNDWFAAGVAALLAASSFHITIGLFAAIYANWLALSVVMLFLYFLNGTLVKPNKIKLISTIGLGYVILLLHPWTWAVTIAATSVAGLLTVASFRRRGNDSNVRESLKAYVIVLLSCALPVLLIVLMALSTNVLPSLKSAINYGLYDKIVQSMIFGLWYLGTFGPSRILLTVSFTLRQYLGAFLAYPPTLILSALGAVSMIKINIRGALMLSSWLTVTSITTVLLDSWYQWRVLYLIPFEILAAAGLLGLLQAVDWTSSEYGVKTEHPRLVRNLKILLIIVILSDSVNYALKSAAILPFS